jgi:hypothetical protein
MMMSTLSETLERCLRQIQKPDAPVVAKPVKDMPEMIFQARVLYFQEGTSDKEYRVQIARVSLIMDKYLVNFQYGRRGGTLQKGSKTEHPVSLAEAKRIYVKIINEKLAKGYS